MYLPKATDRQTKIGPVAGSMVLDRRLKRGYLITGDRDRFSR